MDHFISIKSKLSLLYIELETYSFINFYINLKVEHLWS